jgi:hypothetical protein
LLKRFVDTGFCAAALAVFAVLTLTGCEKAPPKPLISGGHGGMNIDRALERRNAADLDIPPPVDMQELPPPAP